MRHLVLGLIFLCLAVGLRPTHAQASNTAGLGTPTRGEKIHITGIPNAGKVSEQLYRGAQPGIGSIVKLREIGITTIVDLRAEDTATRDQEKEGAEKLGIHFVSIPVGGWSDPTNNEIAQFLSFFEDQSKERVFIHCHFGEDRTGVFVATYRMAIQKWTAEQALSEMYYFGFNGFWHPHMISFVRNFPVRITSVPALVKFSNPTPSVSTIISPN